MTPWEDLEEGVGKQDAQAACPDITMAQTLIGGKITDLWNYLSKMFKNKCVYVYLNKYTTLLHYIKLNSKYLISNGANDGYNCSKA